MSATSSSVPKNRQGDEPANLNGTLARARKLMADAVGIDSHIDTIQRVVMGEDMGERHDAGHVDLPRLREREITANGLEDVSKMPSLIAVLMKRGYADGDLKKILGENSLRVLREVTGE